MSRSLPAHRLPPALRDAWYRIDPHNSVGAPNQAAPDQLSAKAWGALIDQSVNAPGFHYPTDTQLHVCGVW